MAQRKRRKRPQRRRRGLGSGPETHRRTGGLRLHDAIEHADKALRAVGRADCPTAFKELIRANRFHAAGVEHAVSAGEPLRVDPEPQRKVDAAMKRFERACSIEWNGRDEPDRN